MKLLLQKTLFSFIAFRGNRKMQMKGAAVVTEQKTIQIIFQS